MVKRDTFCVPDYINGVVYGYSKAQLCRPHSLYINCYSVELEKCFQDGANFHGIFQPVFT